jgi:hypothetical protein
LRESRRFCSASLWVDFRFSAVGATSKSTFLFLPLLRVSAGGSGSASTQERSPISIF